MPDWFYKVSLQVSLIFFNILCLLPLVSYNRCKHRSESKTLGLRGDYQESQNITVSDRLIREKYILLI